MSPDLELPLEVQLRLANWKQENENLSAETLRELFMTLATEAAKKDVMYRAFIEQLTKSENQCQRQLASIETECTRCQKRLHALMFPSEI